MIHCAIHGRKTNPIVAPTPGQEESSATVAARVAAAWARQLERRGRLNAHVPSGSEIEGLAPEALAMLETAARRFHLSPRACQRTLRVARTISDIVQQVVGDRATVTHIIGEGGNGIAPF